MNIRCFFNYEKWPCSHSHHWPTCSDEMLTLSTFTLLLHLITISLVHIAIASVMHLFSSFIAPKCISKCCDKCSLLMSSCPLCPLSSRSLCSQIYWQQSIHQSKLICTNYHQWMMLLWCLLTRLPPQLTPHYLFVQDYCCVENDNSTLALMIDYSKNIKRRLFSDVAHLHHFLHPN